MRQRLRLELFGLDLSSGKGRIGVSGFPEKRASNKVEEKIQTEVDLFVGGNHVCFEITHGH